MISKSNKEEIITDLIGLGITFVGKRPNFKISPKTPEQAIVDSLLYAKEDYLVLQLLHTWIQKNHSLIHAEALGKLVNTINNKVDAALLAGLLEYSEDKRFHAIIEKTKKIKDKDNLEFDKTLSLAARIGQFPFDAIMSKFGIKITQLITEQSESKFLDLKKMSQFNPFIKCRMLFGTNSRADVAALMTLGYDKPIDVKNILMCSYETAHRNVNGLKEANWPGLMNYDKEAQL